MKSRVILIIGDISKTIYEFLIKLFELENCPIFEKNENLKLGFDFTCKNIYDPI